MVYPEKIQNKINDFVQFINNSLEYGALQDYTDVRPFTYEHERYFVFRYRGADSGGIFFIKVKSKNFTAIESLKTHVELCGAQGGAFFKQYELSELGNLLQKLFFGLVNFLNNEMDLLDCFEEELEVSNKDPQKALSELESIKIPF